MRIKIETGGTGPLGRRIERAALERLERAAGPPRLEPRRAPDRAEIPMPPQWPAWRAR